MVSAGVWDTGKGPMVRDVQKAGYGRGARGWKTMEQKPPSPFFMHILAQTSLELPERILSMSEGLDSGDPFIVPHP